MIDINLISKHFIGMHFDNVYKTDSLEPRRFFLNNEKYSEEMNV